MSISNEPVDIRTRVLRAAASCVLDYGVPRVTLAEIARRAGVSRPTVYRRWTDTRSILADLLTLHVVRAVLEVPTSGKDRVALVDRMVKVATRLLGDQVVMALLHSDLAMVYIAERLGRSQWIVVETLADWVHGAQQQGSARAGDPRQLAAMALLITQSTILSAHILGPILDTDALTVELTYALNGYLS